MVCAFLENRMKPSSPRLRLNLSRSPMRFARNSSNGSLKPTERPSRYGISVLTSDMSIGLEVSPALGWIVWNASVATQTFVKRFCSDPQEMGFQF